MFWHLYTSRFHVAKDLRSVRQLQFPHRFRYEFFAIVSRCWILEVHPDEPRVDRGPPLLQRQESQLLQVGRGVVVFVQEKELHGGIVGAVWGKEANSLLPQETCILTVPKRLSHPKYAPGISIWFGSPITAAWYSVEGSLNILCTRS